MVKNPSVGKFIVFEGGDGAGKGSALAAVADALATDGHDVLTTREPGGTPEGLELRALLLSAAGAVWDQGSELLLMTAARIQHVKRIIRPAVAAGRIVLCDRFVGSTLAYQGAGRGLPTSVIRDLHTTFVEDVWPDLTVLMDVEARIGIGRSQRRLTQIAVDEGRFEALDLAFHERVRASFLEQAAADADRTIIIDAARPLDSVHPDVVSRVRAWLTSSLTTG